jgi:hypothetical protein
VYHCGTVLIVRKATRVRPCLVRKALLTLSVRTRTCFPQRDIPWMVVLTKGDLLDCDALAQCVLAIQLDLAPYVGGAGDHTRQSKELSDNSAALSIAALDKDGTFHETGGRESSAKEANNVHKDIAGGTLEVKESTESTEDAVGRSAESGYESGSDVPGGADAEVAVQNNPTFRDNDSHSDDDSFDAFDSDDDGVSDADSGDEGDVDNGSVVPENAAEGEEAAPVHLLSAKEAREIRRQRRKGLQLQEQLAHEKSALVPENVDVANKHRVPVHVISASTGAGIQQLWHKLCAYARSDAPLPLNQMNAPTSAVVREHRLAAYVRGHRALPNAIPSDRARSGRGGRGAPMGQRDNKTSVRPPPVRLGKNRRAVKDRAREAEREEAKR